MYVIHPLYMSIGFVRVARSNPLTILILSDVHCAWPENAQRSFCVCSSIVKRPVGTCRISIFKRAEKQTAVYYCSAWVQLPKHLGRMSSILSVMKKETGDP